MITNLQKVKRDYHKPFTVFAVLSILGPLILNIYASKVHDCAELSCYDSPPGVIIFWLFVCSILVAVPLTIIFGIFYTRRTPSNRSKSLTISSVGVLWLAALIYSMFF
jgi:hypothetical protein